MNYEYKEDEEVEIFGSLVSAIIGGLIVHWLNVKREVNNARRNLRIEFLLQSYQRLINASNRGADLSSKYRDDLESALSDIVLLGKHEEIEAACNFMKDMSKGKGGTLDPVIESLRNSLRRELGLEQTALPKPHTLRMN